MKNCGKMNSPGEIFQLCRLCLALNNPVNVPIFGEPGDIRQISLKISSCLPVKIAADDLLPKNICEFCSDKLELFYAFWNSSQEAEKKLQAWVQQISINNASETISAVAKQISNSEVLALTVKVKEEMRHPDSEDGDDKMINKTVLSQRTAFPDENVDETVSGELPPLKRVRGSLTFKEEINISQKCNDDEYDVDEVEHLKKVEVESGISDPKKEKHYLSFVRAPSKSAKEPQPGPSEEGKNGSAAPINLFIKGEVEIAEEDLLEKVKQEKAITEQTTNPRTKMKCDHCNQIFLTKSGLIIHTATHTGKKDYECDLCHKIFTRTIPFRDHYRNNHIGTGIFNCEICNKTFYKKSNLMRHKKIHAPPEEEFICGYCKKVFWFKNNLRTHIMMELEKRKKGVLKCEYCDEFFVNMPRLIIHKITHTDEKYYKCDLCPKVYSYTQNRSFISHYRRKHITYGVLKGCKTCNRSLS